MEEMQKVTSSYGKIMPLYGLPNFRFGMSVLDILRECKLPEDWTISRPELDGSGSVDIEIEAEAGRLILSFDVDDQYLLGTIELRGELRYLYGQLIRNLDDIKSVLNEKGIEFKLSGSEMELAETHSWITADAISIQIFLNDGVVDSISYFPDYTDEGEVIWPEDIRMA